MNLERLINDNPNLSCSALHKLTGVKYQTIYSTKTRLGAHRSFQHKGCGIPLVSIDTSRGLNYKVRIGSVTVFNGGFDGAMENLDRLIFCLENNNGQLPQTFEQSIFNDLGFIKEV